MDWPLALQRNQAILLRNVAWLFTWLKVEVGGSVETVSRLKWRTVLFVLRPSESAFRRLILVAMLVNGISAPPIIERLASANRGARKPAGEARERAMPSFKLVDQRKNFDLHPNRPKYVKGPGPRVTDLWSDDPIYDRSALYAYQERMNRPPPTPEDEVDAIALCRRMNALMAALGDLPAQALRMAKLLARAKRERPQVGKFPLRPLRPGLPPGYRQRPKHEVDEVLAECHRLVLTAQHELEPPEP